jgi:fused signal recognition particle receptor
MAFWRRKKDQFVSLGLNQPTVDQPLAEELKPEEFAPVAPPPPDPAPAVTPWQTSVLGLDLSIEELQQREAALEQEFSARFRRAVSATRESLSQKIDAVFAGAKHIDAELLDELEEALIAADIGVPTTMHVLETVRRGISRKEIDDIEKLKDAIKSELLSILQGAEKQGVAS